MECLPTWIVDRWMYCASGQYSTIQVNSVGQRSCCSCRLFSRVPASCPPAGACSSLADRCHCHAGKPSKGSNGRHLTSSSFLRCLRDLAQVALALESCLSFFPCVAGRPCSSQTYLSYCSAAAFQTQLAADTESRSTNTKFTGVALRILGPPPPAPLQALKSARPGVEAIPVERDCPLSTSLQYSTHSTARIRKTQSAGCQCQNQC